MQLITHLTMRANPYAGNLGEWIAMAFIATLCITLPFITVLGFRLWVFNPASRTKGVMFVAAYLASLAVNLFITTHLPYKDMYPGTALGVMYMIGLTTGLSLYIATSLAVLVFTERYDPNIVPFQALIKARTTHIPMPKNQVHRHKESLFDEPPRATIRSMPAIGVEYLDRSTSPVDLPRELMKIPLTVTQQAPAASLATAILAPPSAPQPRQPRPAPPVQQGRRRGGRHAA